MSVKVLQYAATRPPPLSTLSLDSASAQIHAHITSPLPSSPLIPYPPAYALQASLSAHSLALRREHQQASHNIILLEHAPVYTLGRRGDIDSFLFASGLDDPVYASLRRSNASKALPADPHSTGLLGVGRSGQGYHHDFLRHLQTPPCSTTAPLTHPANNALLLRVDRGGDVTWHGPGQLTCYPLIDLTSPDFKKDLHWYLQKIEDVVITVLHDFNVAGHRDPRGTGVWVDVGGSRRKIATVGIGCASWITRHGFAINVTRESQPFAESIVPCGIEKGEGEVCCLEDVVGDVGGVPEVAERAKAAFEEVFQIELTK